MTRKSFPGFSTGLFQFRILDPNFTLEGLFQFFEVGFEQVNPLEFPKVQVFGVNANRYSPFSAFLDEASNPLGVEKAFFVVLQNQGIAAFQCQFQSLFNVEIKGRMPWVSLFPVHPQKVPFSVQESGFVGGWGTRKGAQIAIADTCVLE